MVGSSTKTSTSSPRCQQEDSSPRLEVTELVLRLDMYKVPRHKSGTSMRELRILRIEHRLPGHSRSRVVVKLTQLDSTLVVHTGGIDIDSTAPTSSMNTTVRYST